jgi:hypothetical protein
MECKHERMAHWTTFSKDGADNQGRCLKCGWRTPYRKTWEECRIDAGRKPTIKINWKARAALLERQYDELFSAATDIASTIDEVYYARDRHGEELSKLEGG